MKKIARNFYNALFAVLLFVSFSLVSGYKTVGAFAAGASLLMSAGVIKLPKGILGTCATVCDCNDALNNTGQGCITQMKVEKRPWIMNEFDSAGNLNFIDLTATLNSTYFDGLLNNVDPLARLYPLPHIYNIDDVREKPLTYATKDGLAWFVRNGIRSYAGFFMPDSACPQLVGILEGQRCASPCKFSVDADGTIWGRISTDGTKLYPVKMVGQSVAAIYTKATDTEPQMVGYMFNYDPSEQDCQLRGLPSSELVGNINPLWFDGLLDVNMTIVSASHAAGTIVAQLFDNYGTPLNPETVKGLTKTTGFSLANALYNITDAANVTINTVVEGPQGTYTITPNTMPAAAKVLQLNPSKTGFDFTSVKAVSIVVAT